MEIKCNNCQDIFEINIEECDCNSIEQDKVHTRFECTYIGLCHKCDSSFEIQYEYWIDNISNELVNDIEEFYSDEVELVQ